MAALNFTSQQPSGRHDCIVIGSGMGGLTTAALLAKHGRQRVLVLERHAVLGGFTHTFARSGYEWDVGLHYVGRVSDPRSRERALFDHVTDGALRWQTMPDRFDRYFFGDRSISLPSGLPRAQEELRREFPGQDAAIRDYFRAVSRTVRASNLYFAEKVIPAAIARLLGPVLRWPFLRHARSITAARLARFTADPMLAAVLTAQWLDYGLPPGSSSFGAHAMVSDHYLGGAAYPIGGASSIAESFVPVIEAAGGRLCVKAEVAQILLDSRMRAIGVVMGDGLELLADRVVSAVGARTTFSRLLPVEAPGRAAALQELGRIPPSIAHVALYVGLRNDGAPDRFGAANLWWFPSNDHDGNHARYMADPDAPLAGLFVSFPSAKDPTFAARHGGRSTIEVIAPAAHGWFAGSQDRPWRQRGPDYEAVKRAWGQRLRSDLERLVPSVRGQIDHIEVSTPVSTQHFTNHPAGEIYGLAHTPERFGARRLTPRTGVRNLFLTGQDIVICGVTGALMSGYLTASAMLRRNLLSVRS